MQVFISPRAPQCETLLLESKRALYLVNTFEEFLYAYGGQRMQLGAWPQSILGINYAETWSCYRGGDKHCGRCGTCVERQEALAEAGIPDPTDYE